MLKIFKFGFFKYPKAWIKPEVGEFFRIGPWVGECKCKFLGIVIMKIRGMPEDAGHVMRW